MAEPRPRSMPLLRSWWVIVLSFYKRVAPDGADRRTEIPDFYKQVAFYKHVALTGLASCAADMSLLMGLAVCGADGTPRRPCPLTIFGGGAG